MLHMIQLSDCLGTLLSQKNDWRTYLAREWHKAVGALADRMRLESVKNDLLIVGVYDPHWITELHYLAPQIIQEINTFLGGSRITRLQFVIATRKNETRKKIATTQQYRHKKASMSPHHIQILSSIKDGNLHDALEKFFYASVT